MKLVLLRGLLREQRHWGEVPALLRLKYPDLEVLTPDLAGNGERHHCMSPCSVSEMVADLRRQLGVDSELEAETESFILVAISMGGMIASQWAFEYPEEVVGMVLINTSFSRFNSLFKRLNPKWYWPMVRLAFCSKSSEQKEQMVLQMTSNCRKEDADLAQRWANYSQQYPVSRLNLLRQLWAAAQYLGELNAPLSNCLILVGEHDELVDPNCSKTIAANWHVELKVHPLAGHDLSIDAPEWLVEQLLLVITQACRCPCSR